MFVILALLGAHGIGVGGWGGPNRCFQTVSRVSGLHGCPRITLEQYLKKYFFGFFLQNFVFFYTFWSSIWS